jgi:hydroxyacylglutathione hydrolase
MKNQLLIRQYELGPMENFLYLLGDPSTKEMAIIDPAWDVPFLIKEAEKLGYKITNIFLTHAHHDHVNGVNEAVEKLNVPVYVSKHEAVQLTAKLKNLKPIEDRTKLKLGNITFDTLHAPGHSPGCQLIVTDGHAICGDVLFINACGRCDLPGSDPRAMYNSLHNVLMTLPDDTIVYPGHNYGPTPMDTLAGQKRTNPYLQCNSLEEFLGERM